jgi:hypothetical protein
MDWANERYVRIYTRDTADDQVLSWQARGLWPLLIRKADRAGVITTNHGPRGIAALIQWPIDVVTAALAELVEDGRVRECSAPRGYVIPNYIQAQETPSSTAQRKREEREARRDAANGSVTKRDHESQNVTESHAESRAVTPSHGQSQTVTPYLAVPNLTELGMSAEPSAPLAPTGALKALKAKVDKADLTARKHPLPSDWEPSESNRAKALDLRIDLAHEAELFRNHHTANGTRFLDWHAAFALWIGKSAKWRDERGGSRGAAQSEIRTNYQPL